MLLSEDLPGCLVVLKAISELIEDHDRQVPVAHTTRLDSGPVGHLQTNPHTSGKFGPEGCASGATFVTWESLYWTQQRYLG